MISREWRKKERKKSPRNGAAAENKRIKARVLVSVDFRPAAGSDVKFEKLPNEPQPIKQRSEEKCVIFCS